MELAERRADAIRIEVARPLEIVGGRGARVGGYTRNLSATGLRARFDGHCAVGANLLVRIALEEGAPPLEKRAKVVWSAPDLYGDGVEVGLRLLADAAPLAPSAAPDPDRAPLLVEGTEVEIECGGIALPAVVSRIGEMSDRGIVQVTLRMIETPDGDGVFAPDEAEVIEIPAPSDSPVHDASVVVEKPPVVERALHYAALARARWRRYGAPVAARIRIAAWAIARPAGLAAGRVAVRLASRLWARIPPRVTARIERSAGRVRARATGWMRICRLAK